MKYLELEKHKYQCTMRFMKYIELEFIKNAKNWKEEMEVNLK